MVFAADFGSCPLCVPLRSRKTAQSFLSAPALFSTLCLPDGRFCVMPALGNVSFLFLLCLFSVWRSVAQVVPSAPSDSAGLSFVVPCRSIRSLPPFVLFFSKSNLCALIATTNYLLFFFFDFRGKCRPGRAWRGLVGPTGQPPRMHRAAPRHAKGCGQRHRRKNKRRRNHRGKLARRRERPRAPLFVFRLFWVSFFSRALFFWLARLFLRAGV